MTSGSSEHETAATFNRPKQRWRMVQTDRAAAALLASGARIPPVLAEILLTRGIHTATEAHQFLDPRLENLHDPMKMLGMSAAVERVERAIEAGERILLYGDYDVDGTVAVVLLKTAIEMLATPEDGKEQKATVQFHVPHRLREGYGLQTAVLE